MAELEFSKIHNVVIDAFEETIEVSEKSKLEIIGRWYFNFLISQEKNLSLILPEFNVVLSRVALNYVRLFTLTFNLCNKEKLKDFEDCCLLNVFKYKPTINEINILEYILNFIEQKGKTQVWNNETYTDHDSFLPVFKKCQLKSTHELNIIYYTFKLFQSIRKHKLINYPVLLDFEKDTILVFDPFKNCNDRSKPNFYCEELSISLGHNYDNEKAADLEEQLKKLNILNRVNIKYPYSKIPHLYLSSLGDKRLNLEFNNRFFYKKPEGQDIILTPEEFNQHKKNIDLSVLDYHVVNTNHNSSLFESLNAFKQNWISLDLNKFIAPYPKYWLLFVNQSLPKEEWVKQFKISYPSIANEPIINDVEDIITELHDLNWIIDALKVYSHPQIIFQELKGHRSKRLIWAFTNFKNYIISENPQTTFIDSTDSVVLKNDSEYIYLNAFDVIGLSNNITGLKLCKVLTPDFMYFGYQPWIKYHIFKYKSDALIEGARCYLDINYEANKTSIELAQKELIEGINSDIKTYRSKYEEEVLEEEPSTLIITETEDLELLPSEEINIPDSNNREIQEIRVITTEGEEIIFRSNENVLVHRDFIRSAPAKVLLKGDLFIDISSFTEIINDDDFINKLSQQPEVAKKYQSKLHAMGENVYETLRNQGFSHSSRNYFKEHYLISEEDISDETHIIPRRKKDWKIICEILSIDDNERNLAFIAYYGRKKQNRLKELYKLVLNLYTENNNLQSSENPEFFKKLENIVQSYDDLFPKNVDYNLSDITEAIASNVKYSIGFKEIRELTVL